MRTRILSRQRAVPLAVVMSLVAINGASAAAIDDIKIEESHDLCAGKDASDENYVVYATNLNPTQTIDVTFKYDSSPSRQHFILFDANLDPVTDRFPKAHTRRLLPNELARIGCSYTYRAAATSQNPSRVQLVITKVTAAYVAAGTVDLPSEEARDFAAFILQGGMSECGPGARPPGMLYLVNLHPYAGLSGSVGPTAQGAFQLSPLGIKRLGCSNGPATPGPLTDAHLETKRTLDSKLIAAPISESVSPRPPMARAAENPGAKRVDELFHVFGDVRSSIVFDASVAQYEDPHFYSRGWLEDAIKSALNAAKQPERPGLNWPQDSLQTKLSTSMSVQSVYDYELIEPSTLQMHVTDDCERPATLTIQFAFEDGAWRIVHTNHDSSGAGKAWYREGMNPTKQYAPIKSGDRSRYPSGCRDEHS